MIDFLGTDEEIFKPPNDVLAKIQHMELSECAYFGTLSKHTPQTMKVGGFIGSQPVTILLDSGSSHSFMDSKLVKQVGWKLVGTKPFEVLVANGGKVKSQGRYKEALISLGGYSCAYTLFALPFDGCDAVLGVDWLSTISPILWDFGLLTMDFIVNDHHYTLSHSNTQPLPALQAVSLPNVEKEFSNSTLGLVLYSLEGSTMETSELTHSQLHDLQQLSHDYEPLFEVLTSLPPIRVHDHQIPSCQVPNHPTSDPTTMGFSRSLQ